jgi:hypothetical protein
MTAGDDIADFSSRGPAAKTLDLKPEIAAPGVNILSSVPGFSANGDYTKAYARMSGTSMASPHIAGVAALIINKANMFGQDLTPFDVKTLLMNNTKILDTDFYGVMDQGAGRVIANDAALATEKFYVNDTTTYLGETHPNITGTVNFGTLTGAVGNKAKTITVEGNAQYSATVIPTTTIDGVNVTVSAQTDNTFEAKVSVTKDLTKLNEQRVEGYIQFSYGQTTMATMPYVAYINVNPLRGVEYIKTVAYDATQPLVHFPLTDDGRLDQRVGLKYLLKVYNDMSFVQLSLYDSIAGANTPLVAGQIYAGGPTVIPGGVETPVIWSGTTFDQTQDFAEGVVEDGIYEMTVTVSETFPNYGYVLYSDYTRLPFVVKTTAADITASAEGNVVSGSIDDLYVDAVPAMAREYDYTLDLNEWYDASYDLKDQAGTLIRTESFQVNQDGTFSIDLGDVTNTYTLTLNVTDAIGLTGTTDVKVTTGTSGGELFPSVEKPQQLVPSLPSRPNLPSIPSKPGKAS